MEEDNYYLYCNFTEKNKFKENRAAAVEDANNGDIGTED